MDRLTEEILSYTKLSRENIVIKSIELDQLLPVMGHESLLTQVLFNLLSNARKFVAPGTSPKVVVRTQAIGDEVRVWVEDNGIGIAPEHAERLFQIFGRIHPDHKYEGTGIGLAVVKKATERMGGTVGYDSKAGEGSRFWVQMKKVPSPR